MKGFGILLMFLVIGTAALMYFGYSSKGSTTSSPGVISIGTKKAMTLTMKSRKLKGNIDSPSEDHESGVNLEDYYMIDPVPSSTNSIRPGPIQHGTPLMPYIPEPSPSPPPGQTKQGEFP